MTRRADNPTFRSNAMSPFQSKRESDFWRDKAMCRAYVARGLDYWFGRGERPLTAREVNKAQEICAVCPVKMQCLNLALSFTHRPDGVWAGMRF